MTRRELLKRSIMSATAASLGYGGMEGLAKGTSSVRPATGEQILPAGKSYSAVVPDTLDWAERARLGINALTRCVNPDARYTMYFQIRYTADPAYMIHMCLGDFLCCNPKWAESLPMLRVMSGSDQNLDIEKALMEAMVELIDPEDGLYYLPAEDMKKFAWLRRADYPVATEPITSTVGDARMILAMDAWFQRDQNRVWLDRMHKMARGLGKVAIHKDDYAYYPEGGIGMEFAYLKYSGYKKSSEPLGEHEGAEGSVLAYHGAQIRALAQWYLRSGDQQALELAGKLARFVMKPKLWGAQAESKWIVGPEHGHYDGHQHGTTLALRGLLAYAYAANDAGVKEFVRESYEYARSRGIGKIGCFGDSAWRVSTEGCSVADMVALAIKLSEYGAGDYWDDADGYARNHLAEMQLVSRDLMEEVSKASVEYPDAYKKFETSENPHVPWTPPMYEHYLKLQKPVADRVLDRSLGQISGFGNPTILAYPSTSGCCAGNGTQALYYAWESAVRYKDGDAWVNLWFNRATPWLDVDSYMPYEGKVVIKNKKAKRLSVRVPGWANKRAVRSHINEQPASPLWVGNYLVFDGLAEKDVVTVAFPMVTETVKYTMPFDREYTLSFKGNTLIDISPRDTNPTGYPIYLRDHYKKATAPMRKVNRYVSDVIMEWA